MNKIILKARDLDGFLSKKDMANLFTIQTLYEKTYPLFKELTTETRYAKLKKQFLNHKKSHVLKGRLYYYAGCARNHNSVLYSTV